MVIREITEVVIGIALVGLALRDGFDTVVVPGESAGALRVAPPALLRCSQSGSALGEARPESRRVLRLQY